MLEAGIAERRTQVVNWDPVDQTVLANEQVIDGRGWRSGALVEKREIPGYYLKITQYADELLDCVADRPAGLARARQADAGELDRQERGRALRLPARHPRRRRRADRRRPAVGLHDARRHDHGRDLLRRRARASARAARGRARTRRSPPSSSRARPAARPRPSWRRRRRSGIDTGLVVEHPLSHEQIPLWVGNYVLMSYGDGAVMGVPAHDERDFAFAKQYGIDMLQVVHVDGEAVLATTHWQDWYADTHAQRHDQLRQLQRPVATRSRSTRSPPRSSTAASAASRPPGACATGASAASATGARRSRSSIARPAASCRCPRRTCRSCCPKT